MWLLARHRRANRINRSRMVRNIVLYGGGLVLLLLAVTGRLPPLFAILSAAMMWINRVLTVKSLWNLFGRRAAENTDSHNTNANEHPNDSNHSHQPMSHAEALAVLGLKPGAPEQEIIAAHKKLMQKIHPDKGGPPYLAARINQARDTLLMK